MSLLTEAQRAWIKTQQTAAKFKPKKKLYPPSYKMCGVKLSILDKFGDWCFSTVFLKKFEWAIMTCIILNTGQWLVGEFTAATSVGFLFNSIAPSISCPCVLTSRHSAHTSQ